MSEWNSSDSLIASLAPDIREMLVTAILADGDDPEELSLWELLSYLPPWLKAALSAKMPEEMARIAPTAWGMQQRPKQTPPPGDWLTWLVLAGRGFGKTRTGAEWVWDQVNKGKTRIALIGPTAADVRDVMVEGESGILAVRLQEKRPRYEPSKRRLTWDTGAMATTYSADEPERLRGPQSDAAWCDEICSWRYPEAWDMLMLGLRIGEDPRCVVTTTPKPIKILRDLVADPTTVITRGSTYENRRNLAGAFLHRIVKRYEGTRLGRQELLAEILDDMPGALWTRALLEELRWPAHRTVPELSRIVVAIDPAVSHGEDSDETGIIVAGKDRNGHGYVLDDSSGRYSPIEWARLAIALYRKYDADRIVAEINNGGEMVENTIRMIDTNVSFNGVHATRGKVIRAEPVAALYEQKRIYHVGSFPVLEDQQCSFTTDLDRQASGLSPDRVDALVWAFTELLVEQMPSQAAFELAREQAEAVIARRKAEEEARRAKPNPSPGSMEYMKLLQELNRP